MSWNCGFEGPTSDPAVTELRCRLQRALLATTLLAQGTPMLCAGDETGHTQDGNNNPYCQDNPTTWINWASEDEDLIHFTARVLSLRRHIQPFRNHWYSGDSDAQGVADLTWLQADGSAMEGAAWNHQGQYLLGCLIGHPGRAKLPVVLLFNPGAHDADFVLPPGNWQSVLDTSHRRGTSTWVGSGRSPICVPAHSLVMLASAGTAQQALADAS
jgi:glycogen operon protein